VIIKHFKEQVDKHPNKIAVKTKDIELTYDQLDRLSNVVANTVLLQFKNNENDGIRAALLFEHGIGMIIGTLGALKADTVYVPFDPFYPESRLLYMLDHSNAEIIITNNTSNGLAEKLAAQAKRSICVLNIDRPVVVSEKAIEREVDGNKLIYILYTSGSTGTPKGIMQNSKNVYHFARNYIEKLDIKEADRLTLFSAFSHDAAVVDIYSGLLSGATLYPLNVRQQIKISELYGWMKTERITIWHSVPTLYRYFVNELSEEEDPLKLRYVVLGGESVVEQDVITFKKLFKNSSLVNLYGQSESSYNSSQIINEETDFDGINLGEPISNTRVLIVNDKGRIASPFSAGEIVVASDYLALGYWRDKEKTDKAFENHTELGRIYRTGDWGRFNEDGMIEYLGRKDFQIKIRGYRVEIEEVENCLLKHRDVKEAAVVCKEDESGSKYLCAYFTSDEGLSVEAVRKYIANELPDYMVPSFCNKVDQLLLTPNGKVDRKALMEIEEKSISQKEYEAPRNELECKLAKLWQDILHVEPIGINNNFFELGGHSLKATTLSATIQKELIFEVPLKEIFKTPTIKGLSEYMTSVGRNGCFRIEKAYKSEYYEVSSSQKRIFILQQLEPESTSYNMPGVLSVEGKLNIERLKGAFESIINRHEVLRTSFSLIGDKVVQIIHSEVTLDIAYLETKEEVLEEKIRSFISHFDLSKAPLLRACILRLSEEKHIVLFDIHHIISDGMSLRVFFKELVSLYKGERLPELNIQYKDYSVWQNKTLKSDVMKKQEEYWLEHLTSGSLGEQIPLLNLQTDYPRSFKQNYEGDAIRATIDPEMTLKIKRAAEGFGVTVYMLMLAAYNILLYKYTEQEDIIVGSPIAGRQHTDTENLIGMFVNTLVMRNYPQNNITIEAFLSEVKKNAIKAYENQDYPFEELVEKLNIRRDLSRNPIFDTMFSLQNMDDEELEVNSISFSTYEFDKKISKFDISLNAVEAREEIKLVFEYSTKLFSKATISRMVFHYIKILEQLIEDKNQKLSDINILTEQEQRQLVYEFNNTKLDYSKNSLVHELFESQVRETPQNIALIYRGESLTYKELNEKANQLARLIRQKGVGCEKIVGIMTRRSFEMIIGILAVLKAGGAYIPIDPEYPLDRIQYMLDDSHTEVLLTQDNLACQLNFKGDIIDIGNKEIYKERDLSNLQRVCEPGNLAYIIYTSGSTGRPKGILIEHRSVVNFICSMSKSIDFKQGKAILALTTISFDIFMLETLMPLSRGLKVVIADELQQLDSKLLAAVIEENKVEILQTTPSRMQLMISSEHNSSAFNGLKEIMIGGEAFSQNLLTELKKLTAAKIYNMYGPTETTVWSTFGEQTNTERIDIGRPIANTRIYIIDKGNNLKPIGIAGELCIAGDGVGRGYLNLMELTEEKFVQDPFYKNEKMYKTGDIARFLPDGSLEYIGRLDNQVKIRGHRIELGEIEALLRDYPEISEAVIVAKSEQNGNQYLVAYYTAASEIAVTELREGLAKSLPDYMVPEAYVFMEKLPRTLNEKLDRNALPDRNGTRPVLATEYKAAETEVEAVLVSIWKDILKHELIGIHDNFFDLGGNSFLLIKMHGELEKQYPGKVKITDIFAHPSISKLSKVIETKDDGRAKNIKLKTLMLPSEYFKEQHEDSGDVIHLSLDLYTYKQFIEIKNKCSVSISDILLGAFVYVMYELSGRQAVPVNVAVNECESLLPLYFELENIQSIGELVQLTKQKQDNFKMTDTFLLQHLKDIQINKEPTEVLLQYLYNYRGELIKDTSIFDIIVKVYENTDTINFTFEYNTRLIRKEKMNELVHYYLQALEAIVERML